MGRMAAFTWGPLLLSLLAGCSSTRVAQDRIDADFRDRSYDSAIEELKKGLEKEGDGPDQLLYLLDLGLINHTKGDFEESNQYLLQADRIAEIKDYTSLSTEAATFLVGDNIKHYKGEDFENVLISTYLALNFAAMGNLESALVEARRVNRKLYLMKTEGKRNYEQSAFARYYSAILYEAQGEYDSAYIDYKETFRIEPSFREIGVDLWRAAILARRQEDLKKWESEFELTEEQIALAKDGLPKSGKGEVVVVFENGIGPEKRPNPQFTKLPKFYPRYNPVTSAKVSLKKSDGKSSETVIRETRTLDDIEAMAILNLDEKYGGIIAKKIGGVVVKEVIAGQVARQTDSPLLGFLTRVALHASDQADLRSWKLLPRDLQIARVFLDPGAYELELDLIGSDEKVPPKTVEVRPGKKKFLYFRYVPGF